MLRAGREARVDGEADEEAAGDAAEEDGEEGEAGVGLGPAAFADEGHWVGEEEDVHEAWGWISGFGIWDGCGEVGTYRRLRRCRLT